MRGSKKNPYDDKVLQSMFDNPGSRGVIAARCGVSVKYLWEVLSGKNGAFRKDDFMAKAAAYLLELEEAKKRDRNKADEMMEKVRQLKADTVAMSGG